MLSAHIPAFLTALAVAAVLTKVYANIRRKQRLAKLGGPAKVIPSYLFALGLDQVYDTIKAARENRNGQLWSERFEQLGHTVEACILGQPAILTDDPENIKALLASQFNDYGKGEDFHQQWRAFLGDSIFTTDGKEWSESRHLIRPQFIKDRVSDLHIFEEHIQHMMSLIPANAGTFDISDLFYRFTLDSATHFLLGRTVNSLGNPKIEFAKAFADIQAHMNNVSRVGPLHWLLPARKFKRDLKVLNDFIEPFVEEVLSMHAEELKGRSEKGYTFLHALAQFTRDKRMLRDQLVSVLLAARDTTAGTLSWTLYHLSLRPEIVKKLRAEILNTVGPTEPPTYSNLKNMKYLQHVLDETLRLYPQVPFNVRHANKDTNLPHGSGEDGLEPVAVAAGTPVGYSTLTMQRRADLFGPDVMEYKPERWETWTPRAWQYIPFNGGPRICVGQQFALVEMGYSLCRLFQNFEAVESRMTEQPVERCEITISPGAGVQIGMKRVE